MEGEAVTDGRLFDVAELEVNPKLGVDARRTVRRRALLVQGIHPLRRTPTRPDLGTCGDCTHIYRRHLSKTYLKCSKVEMTGGPATDVRASWPACDDWERQT